METFSALLAICAGNSPGTGDAGLWSLNCVWIDGWVNNREAGDLRRNQAYYDVIVMIVENEYAIWCLLILVIGSVSYILKNKDVSVATELFTCVLYVSVSRPDSLNHMPILIYVCT